MGEEIPEWVRDAVAQWGPAQWGPAQWGPAASGQLLRRWGASEVWRVAPAGGVPAESVIVKRAGGELVAEARRYRDLVAPLGLDAPRLHATTGGDPVTMVLQDVGRDTLEQRPGADGYRAAVRALVSMRATAAARLTDDPSIGAPLRRGTGDFVDLARRAAAGVAALRPDLPGRLDESVLVRRLDGLAGVPVTVVHGDFVPKNLVHAGGRMVPVDWPDAYLHAHLGDLFSLIKEAGPVGRELPALYARYTGTDLATVTDQLATGQLCWALAALRWVVEDGVAVVPESRGWIDELVALVI